MLMGWLSLYTLHSSLHCHSTYKWTDGRNRFHIEMTSAYLRFQNFVAIGAKLVIEKFALQSPLHPTLVACHCYGTNLEISSLNCSVFVIESSHLLLLLHLSLSS
jgi:hypothetical protein